MVLLFSCGRQETETSLDKAEAIIEAYPDSALNILQAIDKTKLVSRKERARYALLKSMAIDKNYIDTTTFDILQPAIDYYFVKGTPDEKLKTYYYQGRIFQNSGDRDKAMNSFLNATELAPEIKDSVVLARVLVAQALLYNELYDTSAYVANYRRASQIYKTLSDWDHEFDCLLNVLNGYIVLNDKKGADSIMNSFKSMVGLNDIHNRLLNRYRLSYELRFGSKEDVLALLERYGSDLAVDANSMIDIALAYDKIGEPQQAESILEYLKESGSGFDDLKYEAVYVGVLEDIGDYGKALDVYKDFSHRLDSINALKFEQRNLLLEEKHKLELKIQSEKRYTARIIWWCVVGILGLSLSLFILILLVRSHKMQNDLATQKSKMVEIENSRLITESEKLEIEKRHLQLENRNLQLEKDNKELEAENLYHRIEILEEESDSLKKIMKAQKGLPPEVFDTLKERLEMLNSLLAGYITDNDRYEKPYESWVKELTEDSEKFMNSNRLAFQASHPRFIKYLEDHGLTLSEINYACLYALGLKGKEVGNYIKKRGHVNISSGIRKKLGIDKHETNIGIYVRRLLGEF